MRADAGSLRDQRRVHVHDPRSMSAEHPADRLEDRQARDAPPARVGVRKMRAQITEAQAAEKRVAYGVRQHVAIRVGFGTPIVRQGHASQDEREAPLQSVNVVADPDAKLPLAALRHGCPPARRCDSIAITSDGSVSFKFEGSPGTTATAMPAASTSHASSVAAASVSAPRA